MGSATADGVLKRRTCQCHERNSDELPRRPNYGLQMQHSSVDLVPVEATGLILHHPAKSLSVKGNGKSVRALDRAFILYVYIDFSNNFG